MLISMTGSAIRKVPSRWGNFTFILNSFNHRFLEVSVNLPSELVQWEVDIQRIIKRKLSRGQVNFHLEWERGKEAANFQVNIALLESYYENLKKIKEKFHLSNGINLSLLAQFPEVFISKKEFASNSLWSFLKKNIKLALRDLTDTRKKEGRELQEDISHRIDAIDRLLKEIKAALPKIMKQYREKLEHRLSFSINEDRERVMQEVLLQVGKIDITEEITRMSSHLRMFTSEMKKRKSSGKRMDFICQEMLREINTIGSKIGSTGIALKIVDLKTELDKIREQLRNVE